MEKEWTNKIFHTSNLFSMLTFLRLLLMCAMPLSFVIQVWNRTVANSKLRPSLRNVSFLEKKKEAIFILNSLCQFCLGVLLGEYELPIGPPSGWLICSWLNRSHTSYVAM